MSSSNLARKLYVAWGGGKEGGRMTPIMKKERKKERKGGEEGEEETLMLESTVTCSASRDSLCRSTACTAQIDICSHDNKVSSMATTQKHTRASVQDGGVAPGEWGWEWLAYCMEAVSERVHEVAQLVRNAQSVCLQLLQSVGVNRASQSLLH